MRIEAFKPSAKQTFCLEGHVVPHRAVTGPGQFTRQGFGGQCTVSLGPLSLIDRCKANVGARLVRITDLVARLERGWEH